MSNDKNSFEECVKNLEARAEKFSDEIAFNSEGKAYTCRQLLVEVKNQTTVGKSYLESYKKSKDFDFTSRDSSCDILFNGCIFTG
jgi:hypothetical protein